MFKGYPKKVNNKWGAFVKSKSQPKIGDLIVITTKAGKQWISICEKSEQYNNGYIVTFTDEKIKSIEVKYILESVGVEKIKFETMHPKDAIWHWNIFDRWNGDMLHCPFKVGRYTKLIGCRYAVKELFVSLDELIYESCKK